MDTTRRDFLTRGCCAAGGLLASGGAAAVLGVAGCTLPWPAAGRTVRFGVVADAHYSTRKRWRDRHYADSLAKMREAVDAFNKSGLDFAIELGDLKDMGIKPDREETLGLLDAIEAEFARFDGPVLDYGDYPLFSSVPEGWRDHLTVTGTALEGKGTAKLAVVDVKLVLRKNHAGLIITFM